MWLSSEIKLKLNNHFWFKLESWHSLVPYQNIYPHPNKWNLKSHRVIVYSLLNYINIANTTNRKNQNNNWRINSSEENLLRHHAYIVIQLFFAWKAVKNIKYNHTKCTKVVDQVKGKKREPHILFLPLI